MSTQDFLNNLWRWKCDLEEITPKPPVYPTLEELQKTEWSEEFEKYMRIQLIVGGLRYGRLAHTKEAQAKKKKYDYIGELKKRADLYLSSGNKEYLVDVAACAMLEFVQEFNHPNPQFVHEDDVVHFEIPK